MKFKPKGKFYRLNFFIQARTLRLLDEQGKQIGIVTKDEALRLGREKGMDVVEIAPNANPPVAKLINFKKFKYLEAKKEREEKKKQKHVGVKEVRLSPFIGQHDLEIRQKQAQGFLNAGNQVKVNIAFKGRQITRKDFGFSVLNKFFAGLSDMKIVRPAHFEGKILVAFLAPDKKGKQYENENQKNSGQEIQNHKNRVGDADQSKQQAPATPQVQVPAS